MPLIHPENLPVESEVQTDLCICGAGAAGLFLATALAERGLSAIVLEAGGKLTEDECASGLEAEVEGGYRATRDGRAFGLGGTTSRWGGQMVPHTNLDLDSGDGQAFDFWTELLPTVERHAPEVYRLLGVENASNGFQADDLLPAATLVSLRARGLEVVTGDWLPFSRRNFATLLNRTGHAAPQVYLNSPVVGWELRTDGGGQLVVVTAIARSRNAKTIRVRARRYVLAAGTIESTRILLEIERALGRPLHPGAALGRYLGDHLSCRVAEVAAGCWRQCATLFGPRFTQKRMRTFRLLPRARTDDAPRAYFHFIYEYRDAGIQAVRNLLTAFQTRRWSSAFQPDNLRGTIDLFPLAWHRYLRHRLYLSPSTPAHLQLDIEQTPNPENRVLLSSRRDAHGRPKALIRWQVTAADTAAIRSAAVRFLRLWPEKELNLPLQPVLDHCTAIKPHDVYHPVGTCRMGVGREAVVDPQLRVHNTQNLWLLSTAVFPTAGTANPTFSLLCLGAALAERLRSEL